ncbi:MAG TPA: hypothetical protein VEY30_10860 [Myxococcaceae bacterium]|nr:hypothetical protein [Myxococcaceae bacterium]
MPVRALWMGLLLVAGGAMAEEEKSSDLATRVEGYLGVIDTPVTAETWRSLGPDALPILESIASSAEALPGRRARAIKAWGLIAGEESAEWLVALAQEEAQPFPVRRSALLTSRTRLSEVDFLQAYEPVLQKSSNVRLRLVAAEALIQRSPVRGCASVRNVALEVGLPLEQALKRCKKK